MESGFVSPRPVDKGGAGDLQCRGYLVRGRPVRRGYFEPQALAAVRVGGLRLAPADQKGLRLAPAVQKNNDAGGTPAHRTIVTPLS